MEAETAPLAPFLDGSDATRSEELPASESVVSPLLPEPESLLPEPESLLPEPEPPAAEEATEFASDSAAELAEARKGASAAKGDSAAELAEAGEHSGEGDTLGLVSSTFDSAAGLEAWGGDDTGGGDVTLLTCEEASASHMNGATALQLGPNTIRTMNAILMD